jgi:hypothetical protein
MAKSPIKVVEEKFDSLEDLLNEKCDEIVNRISGKIERAFEHILSSVRKNTEANLGRALSDSAKKTKSKGGKCSGCKKVFKYFKSVEKHHLKDGICPKTEKKAKSVNA